MSEELYSGSISSSLVLLKDVESLVANSEVIACLTLVPVLVRCPLYLLGPIFQERRSPGLRLPEVKFSQA